MKVIDLIKELKNIPSNTLIDLCVPYYDPDEGNIIAYGRLVSIDYDATLHTVDLLAEK